MVTDFTSVVSPTILRGERSEPTIGRTTTTLIKRTAPTFIKIRQVVVSVSVSILKEPKKHKKVGLEVTLSDL